jgi:hypothetical protein
MQLWTIFEPATGKVLAASFPTASEGSHPKDSGWAWDAATQRATRIAKAPDLGSQQWSGTAWVDAIAQIEAQLLADVKAEAEQRKMLWLSPGGAKKAEYAQKQAEVANWDSLASTITGALAALNLMTADARAAKFSYALASANRRKEATIANAIARFRAGLLSSSPVENIAAEEEFVCDAIKAATTVAAKRAAAAAAAWPS